MKPFKSGIPGQFIVVRCETNSIEISDLSISWHSLLAGQAEYIRTDRADGITRRPWTFKTAREFWDRAYKIGKVDRPLYIFTTGAGTQMRLLGLLNELGEGRLLLYPKSPEKRKRLRGDPLMILESPPFIVNAWDCHDRKVIILDTKNYFDVSLSELAASVELEPPCDLPADRDIMACTVSARRHVEIGIRAILRLIGWVRSTGIGSFGYTVAGQSYLSWKRKHGKEAIWHHGDEKQLNWERKCLYAGRGEMFRTGAFNEPMYSVDRSSFYPWIMRDNTFPSMLLELGDSDSLDQLHFNARPYDYCAEVLIETQSCNYPRRVRGKTIYESGRFKTFLPGPELSLAVRSDIVRKVYRWARYRCDPLFESFVDEYWELRAKAKIRSDFAWDYFAKNTMNALFGKFAQRNHNWETFEPWFPSQNWGYYNHYDGASGKLLRVRAIAGRQQILRGRSWPEHAFPAIAAYVTSLGRLEMNRLRARAGEGNVFAQTTDGLFLTSSGYFNVENEIEIDPLVLGHLRLVSTVNSAEFAGPGVYRWGDQYTVTGRKPHAVISRNGQYEQVDYDTLATTLHDPETLRVRGQRVIRRTGLTSNGTLLS